MTTRMTPTTSPSLFAGQPTRSAVTYQRIIAVVEENKKLKETLRVCNEVMTKNHEAWIAYRIRVDAGRAFTTARIRDAQFVIGNLREEVERLRQQLKVHTEVMSAGPIQQQMLMTSMEQAGKNCEDEQDAKLTQIAMENSYETPREKPAIVSKDLEDEVIREIAELTAMKKGEVRPKSDSKLTTLATTGNIQNEVRPAAKLSRPSSATLVNDSPPRMSWSELHGPTMMNDLNAPFNLALQSHSQSIDTAVGDPRPPPQSTTNMDNATLASQVMTLIGDVDELQQTHNRDVATIASKDARIQELEKSLTLLKDTTRNEQMTSMKQFEETKNKLGHKLLQEQEAHSTLQDSFNNLVTDYKSLYIQSESQKQQGSKDKENVDFLTAKVIGLEEVIRSNGHQLRDLQNKLQAEKERGSMLVAQADVYKDDFVTERDFLQRVTSEKQLLEQKLRSLEMRHQELLNEHETLTRSRLRDMQERHSSAMASHRYSNGPQSLELRPPPPPLSGVASGLGISQLFSQAVKKPTIPASLRIELECPKCGQHWPDIDSLQIHMCDCLNGDTCDGSTLPG